MIIRADARHLPLADETVQCVVTSPPYWGLRDYGTARWQGGSMDCEHKIAPSNTHHQGNVGARNERGDAFRNSARYIDQPPFRRECSCGARRVDQQIGLEPTPDDYLATMVGVFREVWRVLKPDGTIWVNMGDVYASSGSRDGTPRDRPELGSSNQSWGLRDVTAHPRTAVNGLKAKDLVGMPWRLALALQADGWYLRSDIIWYKPNPMPESVTDRPTRAHEYVFLLSKAERYFYDADAIRERTGNEADPVTYASGDGRRHFHQHDAQRGMQQYNPAFKAMTNPNGRNRRDVWPINSEAVPDAHFATFPQKLVEPCILAGTSAQGECVKCHKNWIRQVEVIGGNIGKPGAIPSGTLQHGKNTQPSWNPPNSDYRRVQHGWLAPCSCNTGRQPNIVLDPFLGSGTLGQVSERLGRRWIGTELSAPYLKIAQQRTAQLGLWLLDSAS